MELGVREEDNLAILSLKKSRKDWVRHDVEMGVGSIYRCFKREERLKSGPKFFRLFRCLKN